MPVMNAIAQQKVGRTVIRELLASGLTAQELRKQHLRNTAQTLLQALLAEPPKRSRRSQMTQAEIADFVGITQAAVSNHLNAVTTPSVPIITRLFMLAKQRRLKLPEEVEEWRPL